MKNLLFCALLLLLFSPLHAQTEKAEWNGKTYYVYPHQVVLQRNVTSLFLMGAESQEILTRDDKNRKVVNVTVEPVEKSKEEDFFDGGGRKGKKSKEFFLQAAMKYPEIFYSYGNSLEKDIVPATEAIPDGEYIQYYRDLPYLDAKQVLRYKNDVVAGVFTVRNNKIEGNARWFTADGKLLKEGSYTAGSRSGTWKVATYTPKSFNEVIDPMDYSIDELFGMQQFDTLIESTDFNMGLKNGPYTQTLNNLVLESGSFKNDKRAGHWEIRAFRVDEVDGVYTTSKDLITLKSFSYPDKPVTGKSIILREEIVPYMFRYREQDTTYNFDNYYYGTGIFRSFNEFYTIAYGEEEDLELPEEQSGSYDGADYEGDNYYNDYYDGGSGMEYVNGKYYSRQELIDSLGYQFIYDGVYEEHYNNGQLKMRFEIINGVLQKEEPVYWRNGQVANTISFLPDSNQYLQQFFDFDGKLYQELYYDSAGKQITEEMEYAYGPSTIINDREYTFLENGDTYHYKSHLSPDDPEADTKSLVLLEEKLWKKDSSVCYSRTYDSGTHTYEERTNAISKKPAIVEQIVFDEEFNTVNGFEDRSIGDIRLHTQYNGSISMYYQDVIVNYMGDTMPKSYVVNRWQEYFNITSDATLFVKDQPYSGTFDLGLNKRSYSLKSKPDAITFQLPAYDFKQVWKARYKYWKRGKWSPILDVIQPSWSASDYTKDAVMPMIPFMYQYLYYNNYDDFYFYDEYYEEYDVDRSTMRSAKKAAKKKPVASVVSGRYLNGKPEGLWTIKDQFGESLYEVNFLNGEQDGRFIAYSTIIPPTKKELESQRRYNRKTNLFEEQQPLEKTRYISEVQNYSNGMMDGPAIEYNWKGDTVNYAFYKDDYRTGRSFERNSFVYSTRNYEDGVMDGIAQTYLTLPGRDSLLLFDLNFQNGALQGESKSYHTNGNLSKRGFFLMGEPIDDYEAFDTLGFKYQYVKFQYSQPVEEKIWEENQLSVRYEFNWKDSIPFDVGDISASPSVDRLLIQLGLGGNEYRRPYYGRPSLLDKTGIDYTMTKYYPNDTVARYGNISSGKKVGCWNYYSYEGEELYQVDYFDTVISVNDTVKFKSKGILTYLDPAGNPTSHSYVIEKFEKYDCSHTDHYEERMLYTMWEKDSTIHRINGYAKNYYDNGVLQNEGYMVNGLPDGIWKMYDNAGNLNHVGEYVLGKRQGRWLSGDLANAKYLGDICLNPNLPNLEEIMSYQEKLLDIVVHYYQMGTVMKTEYYGVNLNNTENPDTGYGDEEQYYEGDYYEEGY